MKILSKIDIFLQQEIMRRVFLGFLANICSQIVIILSQFAMVPLFSNVWGAEQYGVWLLLFAVPSYLTLGDLGFGTAAGVRMTMEVAQGNRDAARRTFQTAAVAICTVAGGISIVGVSVILLIPIENWNTQDWSTTDVRCALMFVFAYGLACLLSSLPASGFRCVGRYALGTSLQALTMFVEALVAMGTVWLGGGIATLAAGYLIARVAALGLQATILRHQVPWLFHGEFSVRKSIIYELLPPALAVMALPIAQAFFLQGTALVVGVVVGPAALAAFTTVRTLTRAGVQFTTLLNHALMPEMSSAVGVGRSAAIRRIVLATVINSLAILLPCVVFLSLFGGEFIRLWTRGAIYVDPFLLYVMIAVMVINGLWHPLSNLILSLNRSSSYSYVYACAALLSVLLSWLFCRNFGESGAGVALLLLDTFMAIWVGRLTWSIFRSRSQTFSETI